MKSSIRIVIAAVLAGATLTGCATPAQIDEQNKQLAALNIHLIVIESNQVQAMQLQRNQLSLQSESNSLQTQTLLQPHSRP